MSRPFSNQSCTTACPCYHRSNLYQWQPYKVTKHRLNTTANLKKCCHHAQLREFSSMVHLMVASSPLSVVVASHLKQHHRHHAPPTVAAVHSTSVAYAATYFTLLEGRSYLRSIIAYIVITYPSPTISSCQCTQHN